MVLKPRDAISRGCFVFRPAIPLRANQGSRNRMPNRQRQKTIIAIGRPSSARCLPIDVKATTQNDAATVQSAAWTTGELALKRVEKRVTTDIARR